MIVRWAVAIALVIGAGSASAETGKAVIKPTAEGSSLSGTAQLTDTPEGLKIVVDVANVPPGSHGFHIHQFGGCDNAGKAAGGHYNPDVVQHGFLPKDGLTKAHAGDFGNLEVSPNGAGHLELSVPGLTLAGGKYSVAGRAVVLHDKPDDFGQPTGNAGERIGCGTILITGN